MTTILSLTLFEAKYIFGTYQKKQSADKNNVLGLVPSQLKERKDKMNSSDLLRLLQSGTNQNQQHICQN